MVKEYNDAKKTSIELLRTPVGACELNPIELMWATVKKKIAEGFV